MEATFAGSLIISKCPRPETLGLAQSAGKKSTAISRQQKSLGEKGSLSPQAVDCRLLTLLTSYCQEPDKLRREDGGNFRREPYYFKMPETRNPRPGAKRR